jgi:hypothetical protein
VGAAYGRHKTSSHIAEHGLEEDVKDRKTAGQQTPRLRMFLPSIPRLKVETLLLGISNAA